MPGQSIERKAAAIFAANIGGSGFLDSGMSQRLTSQKSVKVGANGKQHLAAFTE